MTTLPFTKITIQADRPGHVCPTAKANDSMGSGDHECEWVSFVISGVRINVFDDARADLRALALSIIEITEGLEVDESKALCECLIHGHEFVEGQCVRCGGVLRKEGTDVD